MLFDNNNAQLILKLVFVGSGSGATTTLGNLHQFCEGLHLIETPPEPTKFFDYTSFKLGAPIESFEVKVHVYGVPFKMLMSTSRKTIIKDCDAAIFVADAALPKTDSTLATLAALINELKTVNPEVNPLVLLQLNKVDLVDSAKVKQLQDFLDPNGNHRTVTTVAIRGIGVREIVTAALEDVLMLAFRKNVHFTLPS